MKDSHDKGYVPADWAILGLLKSVCGNTGGGEDGERA